MVENCGEAASARRPNAPASTAAGGIRRSAVASRSIDVFITMLLCFEVSQHQKIRGLCESTFVRIFISVITGIFVGGDTESPFHPRGGSTDPKGLKLEVATRRDSVTVLRPDGRRVEVSIGRRGERP